MELVYSADNIEDFAILKSDPPQYFIRVSGSTRSGGWSQAQLLEHIYIVPPADGVIEIDFVATPPKGPAADYIAPIEATGIFQHADWLRGFRILTETNAIEIPLDGSKAEFAGETAERLDGIETEGLAALSAEAEDDFELDFVTHDYVGGEEDIAGGAELASGKECLERNLVTLGNYPETKTEWKVKCIARLFGKCVTKTKVPIVYRRTSKLVIYIRVCWPNEEDIRAAVEDCLKQAIAAGVLAGVTTGNLAVAQAAAYKYLTACLKSKGVGFADEISVKLGTVKRKGKWKRL